MSKRSSPSALTFPLLGTVCFALATLGCESRLPGPADCERMAVRLVGEPPSKLETSPGKMRFIARVTHGCLTTPFDHQAVRCVEETGGLRRCMEELAWRLPERKPSIQRFMTRALEP